MKICAKCNIEKNLTDFHKKTGVILQSYCKECFKIRNKEYYSKNSEKIKKNKKEYYKKNKIAIIKKVLYWNQTHPKERSNYMVFVNAVRRGRKKANGGVFTKKEWLLLLDKYDYRCYYCKQKFEKLSVDHYIPLSKGGKNSIDNIVPACLSCNCKKGNKII